MLAGLAALEEAGVPPKLLILDDGWQTVAPSKGSVEGAEDNGTSKAAVEGAEVVEGAGATAADLPPPPPPPPPATPPPAAVPAAATQPPQQHGSTELYASLNGIWPLVRRYDAVHGAGAWERLAGASCRPTNASQRVALLTML